MVVLIFYNLLVILFDLVRYIVLLLRRYYPRAPARAKK